MAWLSTTGAPGHGLCSGEARVLPHVVGAGLDPDGVVDDAVHDRVGVDSGAEALVPVWP